MVIPGEKSGQQKGRINDKNGTRLCDIDAAARNYISDCGYGQYFTHRQGHFIGQTNHQEGDVSSKNPQKVEDCRLNK